ncbi:MAG: sodium:proton antiporter, partial [Dehalococcoidia bacterium]
PRGIASILFGLLVLERSDLAGREEILVIVMTAVLLSVFAHGISAFPAANWYASRTEKTKSVRGTAEHIQVTEMPVRLPYAG